MESTVLSAPGYTKVHTSVVQHGAASASRSVGAEPLPASEPFTASNGASPASCKELCASGGRGDSVEMHLCRPDRLREHTSEPGTFRLHCDTSSLTQSADSENAVLSAEVSAVEEWN